MTSTNRLLKSRRLAFAPLLLLAAAFGGLAIGPSAEAATAPANSVPTQAPLNAEVRGLLESAERAQANGDLRLALVQLKNAVRLAPLRGEVRAYLGMGLLKIGDTRTAERELRQAWMDNAPEEIVIPAILDSMVVRGEARELLAEFLDPLRGTQSKTAPDILRARAQALQILGRSAEANEAITRSLSLRRDARSLTTRAKLAVEQGDLALAQRLVDEAIKLSPKNEDVRASEITLILQSGDLDKALAAADEFVRRLPLSTIARVIRIEVLLQRKEDVLAQAELDALLTQSPDSAFGPYYTAILLARANHFADAWHQAQTLSPEFVLAQPSIAMMVAEIAIASGNVESAGAILTTLVSRRPGMATARIRLAAVQLTLKVPDSAIKTLEPIKTIDDPQAQAILGQAYMQLGRFTEAIGALEKAAASGTADNNDVLKRQLALSAFELGDSNRAIHDLQSIEARESGDWDVAALLIASLVREGKLDEALSIADHTAKVTERTPLAAFYRGRVLGAKGDLARASAAFDEALAIDPKFLPARYYRAHVSAARGNFEAAKKDFRQVIAEAPTNVHVYLALAQIALHEGQESQAVALLSSAVKVSPSDPAPRMALANYQMNSRKFQEAQTTLNALLQVSPNNPEALVLTGQIQFSKGETARAIETYRSLAAMYADSSGAYVLLAKALNATKDRLAAIDAARRAVELAPFSMPIRWLLIDYLIVAGRPEDALANAREYASAHPGTDADLLVANTLVRLKRVAEANALLASRLADKPDRLLTLQLSQFAVDAGDPKRAVAVLLEWLRKNPTDFDVRRQYASLLLQIGDTTNARKEFEVLFKQRPEDPVVLNNLGWILRDDDRSRALSMVSLAAKIAPESTQIMDTLAWMKFQRQDLQGALLLLRRAHELDAKDGEIGYHYAVALDATGRRAEAKTLLQSVIAKNSEFSDRDNAKKLLAQW